MATKHSLAALFTLLVLGTAAHADEIDSGLASPMMNRAIFRDGQVQRLTGQFGAWTVVCDEVTSLKQRYCSLRASTLRTSDGRSAVVDVSTGDDGKPAALLHLPVAVAVAFGVSVDAAPGEVRSARTAKAQQKLTIATCNGRECLAVWNLRALDIQALNTGSGVTLTFCTPRAGKLEFATDLRQKSCAAKMAGLLPSAGFKEAIQASTH